MYPLHSNYFREGTGWVLTKRSGTEGKKIQQTGLATLSASSAWPSKPSKIGSLLRKPLTPPSPVFKAKRQGKIFQFILERIPGDGNCGFTALETTRKEVCQTLLSLSSDSNVRLKLVDEVYEAFISDHLPATDEWQSYYSHLLEKEDAMRQCLGNIRDEIRDLPSFEGPMVAEQVRQASISWLKARGYSTQANQLVEADTELNTANRQMREYCQSSEAYQIYCKGYLDSLWLGCCSATIYAASQNSGLYIWEKSGASEELALKDHHQPDSSPGKTYHLLFNGVNHFDRLCVRSSSDDESLPYPIFGQSVQEAPKERKHNASIQWIEFVSRILIERIFFQNSTFPPQLLLHLANALIRDVSPPKKEYFNLAKEISITWKQIKGIFTGEPLTPEEEKYHKTLHEIDMIGEIANGLRYSTIALIGQNLFSSLISTVQQGVWSHVPAIAGYAGLAIGGYQGVSYAVDRLLDVWKFSEEQQEHLKPWLNLIGRLALGFVPKVYADGKGVHYQYPSMEGFRQTISPSQTTTIRGDTLTIEREGCLETPEGEFDGLYTAEFKLKEIYELSEESIRIQIVDKAGREVPITFSTSQGLYGPEIKVSCEEKDLERHWSSYFRWQQKETVQSVSKNILSSHASTPSCSTELAVGGLASLVMQTPIPTIIGGLSCISQATALSPAENAARLNDEDMSCLAQRWVGRGLTGLLISGVAYYITDRQIRSYFAPPIARQILLRFLAGLTGPAAIVSDYVFSKSPNLREIITNYYQKKTTKIINPEGENLFFSVPEVYTELVLISEQERKSEASQHQSFSNQRKYIRENLYQPKTPISIEELFNQDAIKNSPKKRLVLSGVAGVGKTTFSEMAAMNGTSLWDNQFTVVFLIKLRNLNKERYPNRENDWTVREVIEKEYEGSFPHLNWGFCQDELTNFLKNCKENALLILDGFDELPIEASHGEGSLKSIIEGFEKSFNHILLTSRPGTVKFKNVAMGFQDHLFEIVGFNRSSIRNYTEKFYSRLANGKKAENGNTTHEEQTRRFLVTLDKNPVLHNLVQIPINLALACALFHKNPTIFEGGTYSLTRFYIDTVDSLYDKYYERPGVQDLTKHLGFSKEIFFNKICQALQGIAWLAIQEDLPYITPAMLDNAKSRNGTIVGAIEEIGFDTLKYFGLIKEEEKSYWEFIHTTFQEYFAGAYLANLYLTNHSAVQAIVKKIKFNPNYAFVLSFAAGYLSHPTKGLVNPLKKFFADLYAEPRDLAGSYELELFAQCFQECDNPEKILQYSEFIANCTSYISKLPEGIPSLFNHNLTLIHHPNISDAILSHLDSSAPPPAILTALALTSDRQSLPENIFDRCVLIAQNRGLAPQILKIAVVILARAAKLEKSQFEKSIKALMSIVENVNMDADVREAAAWEIGAIAQGGETFFGENMHSPVKKLKDDTLRMLASKTAASELASIARLHLNPENSLFQQACEILNRTLSETTLNCWASRNAAFAIGDLGLKIGLAEESNTCLAQTVANQTLINIEDDEEVFRLLVRSFLENITIQKVTAALAAITSEEGDASKKAFKILANILKDGTIDEWTKASFSSSSSQSDKSEKTFLEKAINLLVEILIDTTLDELSRSEASVGLGQITQYGGTIPEVGINALSGLITDENSPNYLRQKAFSTLCAIVRQEGKQSNKAINALESAFKNGDFKEWAKELKTASMLANIFLVGGKLSKIALGILEEMLSNQDVKYNDVSEGLGVIVEHGGAVPESVITYLTKVVNNSCVCKPTCFEGRDAAALLGRIANYEKIDINKMIEPLVNSVNTTLDMDFRLEVASTLGIIALKTKSTTEKAVNALLGMIRDPNLTLRSPWKNQASTALGRTLYSSKVSNETVLDQLKDMMLNNTDDSATRAADTLMTIIELGGEISQESINALVNRSIKTINSAQDRENEALYDLNTIIEHNKTIPLEEIEVLIKIFVNSTGFNMSSDNDSPIPNPAREAATDGTSSEEMEEEDDDDATLDLLFRMLLASSLVKITPKESASFIPFLESLILDFNNYLEARFHIVELLKQIPLQSLKEIATQSDASELVKKICFMTQRAFVVADEEICHEIEEQVCIRPFNKGVSPLQPDP